MSDQPEKAQDPKLEQNKSEKPMSFITMVVITGFIGGLLWSSIAYICYMFSFTQIEPNIILEPWAIGQWKDTWLGIVISIFAYGIVSIGVALVYYGILKKIKSVWAGAAYGIALFLVVFLVLHPLFSSMKPVTELDYNTIITTICLYILYGVFIGYSISYEENELRHQSEKQETRSS
ncbi:YqhR family membrane protein [Rossellomorea sp. BNER]|uniref:YqhR family membrane protein n=1 Tax=Rossellomorea sp. BNER TaxID=2962031 RepID=UPI003AF2872D|nr:YqhR family membrane protein [Rossellomorea sp. BNER]